MAGLPTLQVLLDDGTGTFPFDITSYVRLVQGWSIQRGRQDELAAVTPGSLSLTLDNADGRFTVGSTLIASPSPIKVDARIRVNEAANLPTRTNLVTNPSFEVDTTGWANNNNASLARSTVQSYVGSAALQVTATAAAADTVCWNQPSRQPVTPGATYTAQAQFRAATVGRNVQLALDWLDSSGASISYVTGSQVADVTTGWVQASVTATAPAGAATAAIVPWVVGCAAGEAHYVDAAMIEQSAAAGAYFDGATAAAGGYTYAWTGTANASTSTASATTFTRHTGYVVSWPVAWPSGDDGFSIVTVTATDAQARAERRILRAILEEEILADAPLAYYTLGEAAGAVAASDTSGNQNPALGLAGIGSAVAFGTDAGVPTSSLTAANLAGGQYLATTLSAVPAGFEVWFKTTTNDATARYLLGAGGGTYLQNGHLYTILGADLGAVADGKWHQFFTSGTNVYIDGSLVTTAGSAPSVNTLGVGAWGGGGSASSGGVFVGDVAHVVAFASAPSSARASAHYSAGATGFAGESGTARLTRIAGYAGVTVGTLDSSLTNVAFVDITGTTAATEILDVAAAEFGLTFIDGTGSLTFHNRNRVPLKTTPDVTVDANYLDPNTAFVVDMQGVLNYFEATAAGSGNGAQLAHSATSESSHGRYTGSATYLVRTDAEALDRANWIVLAHKEPGPRLGSLVFDLLTMSAAQQAQLLALEADSWVQITGLPSQTPGGTTANFIVQGFTENLSTDAWTLTLNVADKATVYPSVFILDSSTLDSGDRLYL